MTKPQNFDELQVIANAAGLRLIYDDGEYPIVVYVYQRENRDHALYEATDEHDMTAIRSFLMGWIACQANR